MGIEREPGGLTVSLAVDRGLLGAIHYAFDSWTHAGVTVAATVVAYGLFVLSTFPTYSLQMLVAGRGEQAVWSLTQNLLATAGSLGVFLTVMYAAVTGISVTVSTGLLADVGITDLGRAGGLLPALFAGGCVSCGAGLAGVLGIGGAVALFPFGGNLVRLGGLSVLAYVLARTGDPRYCDLDEP